jgi:hypothetical protein
LVLDHICENQWAVPLRISPSGLVLEFLGDEERLA